MYRGEGVVGVSAVIIDTTQVRFSIVDQHDKNKDSAFDFISLAKQYDVPIMLNGGYFDLAFRPVGLTVRDGVEFKGISDQSPLSGVILTDDTGRIEIIRRSQYVVETNHREAIQAGPFLIDPGGKPGIYSDDLKRAKRSAIGLTTNGHIVLLTTSPCTLFELSQLLYSDPAAIGVSAFDRVLNLDGGPSSGLYLEGQDLSWPSDDPVPNAIAVWPKQSNP